MRTRELLFLFAAVVVFRDSVIRAAPPSGKKWMAMSECWKSVKGKSGRDHKLRIGLSTFDLDQSSCETIGKSKAVGMAAAEWFCFGDDKRPQEVTHHCEPIGNDDEELGLRNIRARTPVMNTYLVFTDLTGHLTQISFWDLPKPLATTMCEAFRVEVAKSGVKDAECVPGNT